MEALGQPRREREGWDASMQLSRGIFPAGIGIGRRAASSVTQDECQAQPWATRRPTRSHEAADAAASLLSDPVSPTLYRRRKADDGPRRHSLVRTFDPLQLTLPRTAHRRPARTRKSFSESASDLATSSIIGYAAVSEIASSTPPQDRRCRPALGLPRILVLSLPETAARLREQHLRIVCGAQMRLRK